MALIQHTSNKSEKQKEQYVLGQWLLIHPVGWALHNETNVIYRLSKTEVASLLCLWLVINYTKH